jgi:ATP-binding cassette subfamily F protein 3
MLSGANLLLLDEPTNHLDIDSKEIFEDALLDFPGTAVIISHDRYLLAKVPTRIMELTPDGMTEYLGKYDYYVEKKEQIESGRRYLEELKKAGRDSSNGGGQNCADDFPDSGSGDKDIFSDRDMTAAKEGSAEERRLKKQAETARRREEKELKKLEQDIENLEIRIHEIEEEMCREDVLSDYLKLDALSRELEESKAILDGYYNKWMQE